MQKLELRNNLNEILKKLKSVEIIDTLQKDIIEKNIFLNLLITSKAGYDQAILDKDKENVFNQFQASTIYATTNFASLIQFVSTAASVTPQRSNEVQRTTLLVNNILNDFFSFHKTLVATFKLIDNVLMNDKDIFDSKNDFNIIEAQNKGNLILEIIDNKNISLKNLSDILDSLEKLIETIYMLYDKIEKEQFDIFPTVSMIDSGSDINFVLKLPEKAANLIAQVIKEFWDFLVNNKNYKHDQKLKTIENSITVLAKIKEAKEKDIIDAETAEVLKKGIITNTENIVLKNTITKQIVMERKEYSNRDFLLEQNDKYLLESGENKNLVEN